MMLCKEEKKRRSNYQLSSSRVKRYYYRVEDKKILAFFSFFVSQTVQYFCGHLYTTHNLIKVILTGMTQNCYGKLQQEFCNDTRGGERRVFGCVYDIHRLPFVFKLQAFASQRARAEKDLVSNILT